MSGASSGASFEGPMRRNATFRAAEWLSLAAAPTFAIMALLTGIPGGGKMAMICGAGQGPSALGGMAPMYLLMSGFHLAPWLKLMSSRRSGARRSWSSRLTLFSTLNRPSNRQTLEQD